MWSRGDGVAPAVTPDVPAPRLLVDGERTGAAGGARFDVVDPATEEVIGTAPDGDRADMDAAIAAARRAFDHTRWATDPGLRVRCLRQLHRALRRHAPDMRTLTVAEAGAPVFLTRGPQYDAPVEGLAWVADLAADFAWERDLGTRESMGVASERVLRHEPVGVVGAITPWNYPTQINLAKVGPALAAGNTVVLKPAPETPWVAAELGRVAAERTDLPPGVLNVVSTADDAVAEQLTTDPRVDLVSFTGSTPTGRRVMAAAAPTVKRVFLELGGKSPSVVLGDADVAEAAAATAFEVSMHAGQGCALTTRLIVPRGARDEAVDAAAATMSDVGVGDPADPGTVCGPLISAAQRDRVEGYLRLAEEEGGTVATGGRRPPGRDRGFWIEPAVITGVDNRARVAREEIFGPVLVVLAHDGDDDAVRIANDSPFGLSAAVTAGDEDRARAVGERIRAGTVSLNGGVWFAPDVPFGGYKQSGTGREMGVAGLEEYLETKVLAAPA